MPDSDDALKLQERKAALLWQVVAAHEREYRELLEAWKNLETKAQGTVGIAGIFLAGVFAFVSGLPAHPPAWHRWALAAAILTLLAAVLFALLSLWARRVPAAPPPAELEAEVRALVEISDAAEFRRRELNVPRDEAGPWKECVAAVRRAYDAKSAWLVGAQAAILAAAVLVSLLTLTAVLPGGTPPPAP